MYYRDCGESRNEIYQATNENVTHNWYLIDAADRRLAVSREIARRLRGKHKPEYTPMWIR